MADATQHAHPWEERFWAKVDKNGPAPPRRPQIGPCWIWTASRTGAGYGQFCCPLDRLAHRIAYKLLVGAIPEGRILDHLCRVRHCVNPDHLEPVSYRENTLRGEGLFADRARQTHCLRGHEYTAANTYRDPKRPTIRSCKTCRRERKLEARCA